MMVTWKRKKCPKRQVGKRTVTLVKRSVIAAGNEVGYSDKATLVNPSVSLCFVSSLVNVVLIRAG